jgi:hypothetical protein
MLHPFKYDNLWYIVLDNNIHKPFRGFDGEPLTFIRENDAHNFCDARNSIAGYVVSKKPSYWETLRESQDIMEQTNNYYIKTNLI